MHAWRWLSFLIAATVGLASIPAKAAIVITGTRVIYPEKSRQVSVRLNSVEDTPVLVQAMDRRWRYVCSGREDQRTVHHHPAGISR